MKKYHKIVLAAGTGHLGNVLKEYFKPITEEIIVLSRSVRKNEGNVKYVQWNAKTVDTWWVSLENADAIINLTGKNVNCRYHSKNKNAILNSRIDSVKVLGAALKQVKVLPEIWMQCSSSTIYRHAEDRFMTEENGEIGEGFSVNVCKEWEKTFHDTARQFPEIRQAILRTSLVLGKSEGVYLRLKNLARFGLGGRQGNGRQMVSWIHETDFAGMVEWILDHKDLNGEINFTAPEPVKNTDFMFELRKSLNIGFGLPSPKLLLEFGAFIIRTETELILKSRWVLPEKIMQSGYRFEFPDVHSAFKDLSLPR